MKLQPIIKALARRLHRAPARPSAPRHARPPVVDRWDAGEQINLAAAYLQSAAALRGIGVTTPAADVDRVRADYKAALVQARAAAQRAWHAGDAELVDAAAFWDLTATPGEES